MLSLKINNVCIAFVSVHQLKGGYIRDKIFYLVECNEKLENLKAVVKELVSLLLIN